MGRPQRNTPGGMIYHVLNRSNAGVKIFSKKADYEAFEKVVEEARDKHPMRILSYCLMPNHWHFVLWPRRNDNLSKFMGWMTLTHTQRWHAHRKSSGSGHVYQGRFKSFPVEPGDHLLTVCRYVERNALKANLVERAEDWMWSSLWRREHGSDEQKSLLSDWPIQRPGNWLSLVNRPQTQAEVEAIQRAIKRGSPFGSESWAERIVKKLNLESTIRPQGRPKLKKNGS